MALSRVVSEIFDVEKCHDLEIQVRGHSRSLIVVPFKRLGMVTGRMPRSGKLPVLFLLTGQKSGFSPRRGDSLHGFRSNSVEPTGIWVRLAVQNFTSIGAGGGNAAPKISEISTFR